MQHFAALSIVQQRGRRIIFFICILISVYYCYCCCSCNVYYILIYFVDVIIACVFLIFLSYVTIIVDITSVLDVSQYYCCSCQDYFQYV